MRQVLVALLVLSFAAAATAADVHVLISAGFYRAYSELAPMSERFNRHDSCPRATAMVRVAAFALLLFIIVWSSGCGTLADAKAARGTGEVRVYDVPANTVWSALPGVVKEAGLEYVGDNRAEGYVLAQRGVTPLSYGENVAIFVQEMRPGPKTRVEVVSKKQVALNVLAPNWESELLDRLAQKLQTAAQAPTVALLEDVDAVPLLNERGRQGYRDWLTRKLPRAFVIAENGAWQSAWGACTKNPEDSCEPAQRAIANCQKRGLKNCRLYAVDNRVVWTP